MNKGVIKSHHDIYLMNSFECYLRYEQWLQDEMF